VSRSSAKEHPVEMNEIESLHTTSYNTSYLPVPALATSIPCPASDRCDTTGVPVDPAISRFCPTLGCLNLVKSVTHRAAASVALAAPIALNVTCGAGPRTLCWSKQLLTTGCLPSHVGFFLESGCSRDSGPPAATVPRALHARCFFGPIDMAFSAYICWRN
jgi:hypothetical protein